MIIMCDSREQKWDHVREGFDSLGAQWVRSKLYVGDYARMDSMMTVVDRKQHLLEVAGNLCQQHERFRAECLRAQEGGIRLVVLVEERGVNDLEGVRRWINPRRKRWDMMRAAAMRGKVIRGNVSKQPPISGERLAAIMQTMTDKYGVEWAFCTKRETPKKILDILGWSKE